MRALPLIRLQDSRLYAILAVVTFLVLLAPVKAMMTTADTTSTNRIEIAATIGTFDGVVRV